MRDPKMQTEREKKVLQEMFEKYKVDIEKVKEVENWRDFDEEFTIKVRP